jgi:hypothetical protein
MGVPVRAGRNEWQSAGGMPGRGCAASTQRQEGGARDGEDDDEDGYRDNG